MKIVTRQSALALWQAHFVKTLLQKLHPHLELTILGLTTTADIKQDTALSKIGGKGLFAKELEEALLDKRADVAVHSMKDLPHTLPEGLTLAAFLPRGEAREAYISSKYPTLEQLPKSARIGSSSLRRQMQLKSVRPDLRFQPMRGNVDTRLKKLDAGECDALILAAVGLQRLNEGKRISQILPLDPFIPAIGQGALGLECRTDDPQTQALLAPLNHPQTEQCMLAERTLSRHLNGNCQVPIAGYAHFHGGQLHLIGSVGKSDGSLILTSQATHQDPFTLGALVAQDLLAQGAGPLLSP